MGPSAAAAWTPWRRREAPLGLFPVQRDDDDDPELAGLGPARQGAVLRRVARQEAHDRARVGRDCARDGGVEPLGPGHALW